MLRFGPDGGPLVVAVLPLFEEANRTRAFVVAILRALAERGIGSVLPDLPGQGESSVPTADMRLADLRAAFAAVPGTHAVAIRSGALLVDARPTWILTPHDGPALVRELTRIAGGPLEGERSEVAGNMVSRAMLQDFASAPHPGEGRDPAVISDERHFAVPNAPKLGSGLRRGGSRVVRLASDPRAADRHVAGEPLWRRAEPDNDRVLAQTLAVDIAEWVATCVV